MQHKELCVADCLSDRYKAASRNIRARRVQGLHLDYGCYLYKCKVAQPQTPAQFKMDILRQLNPDPLSMFLNQLLAIYHNMNRPSFAVTPLLISDATRDLVLSTRLPEQIKQKFAEQSMLDHTYVPTSVLPAENEVDVEVYDDIFELLQAHNDITSQKAMFFLLADIGFELGYTIRQLAREGPSDEENGIPDSVLLRPVEAEPGATLRATLDAVNPRQFPAPQSYEGHNANVDCKFTCPIPPCVSNVVTFGFWHSMTRHLRTAHHFLAADTSELTNNIHMSHLKQLFGPYLITDLETALRPKRRIKKSSVFIGGKPGELLSRVDERNADTFEHHTGTASAEPEAGTLGVTRFPFMEAMLDAMDRKDEENGTYVRGSQGSFNNL